VSDTQRLSLVSLPQRSPLALAAQSFLLECESRRLSPRTLDLYRQKLAPFLSFLKAQNVSEPQGITPAIIRAYLVDLQRTHNAGGVHVHFRTLRTFVRFLVAEGDVSPSPLANVKAPKTPQLVLDPVSLDTVSRMLKACSGDNAERDAAILLTLLDSGLRAAELCALDIGDLDIASGRVVVKHGKGDKGRVVFLGARARKAILKMLKARADVSPAAPLWLTRDGARLAYGGLREILRRRAQDAHIAAPRAHDFRRAFALLSLRGGCDVYALQKLMGHADLTVLRRYLAQTESDLQAAHEKAGVVDKML
jgi:site-specific recombinase XerD